MATADLAACEAVHDPRTLQRVRERMVDADTASALAETFKMLGDPTRVRVLNALAQEELCVCDLASLLGSSESAVSHQLRLLRSARLVRTRRSGRLIFYTLDDDHIRQLFALGLEHVTELQR